MTNRTPTGEAPEQPSVPEGNVEVVTAAGERKPASLPRRAAARIKEVFDPAADAQQLASRDLPTWPDELGPDDDDPPPDPGDQTLVIGNGDVAVPDQPPANVLAAYRRQHAANTATAVDEVARKVGQLVGLDRRARHYAWDVQHLIGIHAICAKAIDQLADHDLVSHALIRELAAEVAGWQTDREVGS
jgi:hypothetical protein